MSNYTQITFFQPKDSLASGNPAKIIKGADVDPELAAIAVAIASKADSSGSATILFANGSATTPSITFANNTNLGFYRQGSNDLGLTVAGVQVGDFQSTTITWFNSVIAGLADFNLVNNSIAATQDMQFTMTAGSSTLQHQVANQNRATALVTNGPTAAQAAIWTTTAIPLVFGTNGT